MSDALLVVITVIVVVFLLVCLLVCLALADAKRKADREFGDWPDQIEDRVRKARQPDDPGTGR